MEKCHESNLYNFKKGIENECCDFFQAHYDDQSLKKLQNEKLKNIIRYVKRNSKFYQEWLHTFDEDNITKDNLSKIPLLTKNELRKAGNDLLCKSIGEMAYYCETSGTTGDPIQTPRSREDVIWNIENYKHSWEPILSETGQIVAIMGPSELHSYVNTFSEIFSRLGCCTVKLYPYSPFVGYEKAINIIKNLKIQILSSTPSSILALAKAVKVFGLDPKKDFDIKYIFVTGELCTEQMVSNIAEIWNCTVYDCVYGTQEAFGLSSVCNCGKLHIFPHSYIYELVDTMTGEFIGEEGTGELVVTMLNPGAKPLLRYRTGDIVTIEKSNHLCHIPSNTIKIHGRRDNNVLIHGRKYYSHQIESCVLKNIKECLSYKLVIENYEGVDKVTVHLEMIEESLDRQEIVDCVRTSFLEIDIDVKVEFSNEIENAVKYGDFKKWKLAWKSSRIIDKRQK